MNMTIDDYIRVQRIEDQTAKVDRLKAAYLAKVVRLEAAQEAARRAIQAAEESKARAHRAYAEASERLYAMEHPEEKPVASEQTTGQARDKLMQARRTARTRSHERRLKDFEKDSQTESDLALASFDDGWAAGYEAGFQQALQSVQSSLLDAIKAQRTGIMATGLRP